LRADKIDRIRSPRRPQADDIRHQRAFFSRKDDLITHLNEVRRIRNNKKL
jgi:DNA polymerase elongation subunit (family B)